MYDLSMQDAEAIGGAGFVGWALGCDRRAGRQFAAGAVMAGQVDYAGIAASQGHVLQRDGRLTFEPYGPDRAADRDAPVRAVVARVRLRPSAGRPRVRRRDDRLRDRGVDRFAAARRTSVTGLATNAEPSLADDGVVGLLVSSPIVENCGRRRRHRADGGPSRTSLGHRHRRSPRCPRLRTPSTAGARSRDSSDSRRGRYSYLVWYDLRFSRRFALTVAQHALFNAPAALIGLWWTAVAILDAHGFTSSIAFGISPYISGAYIASTRVGGIPNEPTLLSRTVYSVLNLPFGTYA